MKRQPKTLTDKFTKYVIFLNLVTNTKTSPEIIKEHVAYLRELDASGKLFMAGPFSDDKGGMIILNARDIKEAFKIASEDPFVKQGVRQFEVRKWHISCEENNHLGMG